MIRRELRLLVSRARGDHALGATRRAGRLSHPGHFGP
jgi:hypothetical protein